MNKKTVIVTGASRGLGAATARILGKSKVRVILHGRTEENLKRVADEIIHAGGEALAVVGDVSKEEDCRVLVQKTAAAFGGIDALINNAGVLEPIAKLSDVAPSAWAQNINVNLLAPLALTQAALPYLREAKGRVINISSGAAVKPVQGWSAYCASKAALNHFTRVLAVEEPQITALALRPGVVDTAMQAAIREKGAAAMAEDDLARFVGLHEKGELLPPELPATALAKLALSAPQSWSGEFIQWDDERIEALA